jgi:hypothetical protein
MVSEDGRPSGVNLEHMAMRCRFGSWQNVNGNTCLSAEGMMSCGSTLAAAPPDHIRTVIDRAGSTRGDFPKHAIRTTG